MAHIPGRAPGAIGDGQSVALFSLRGGLTLTTISGGAIDISNAADGSDTISNIEVATHSGEDLLGGSTVTWATSDTVFAALIAEKINENAWQHHYWATASADHVFIWPQDGTASDTGAITATDTSFTATIANMNIEQASVAATRWSSGMASADAITAATMLQVGFDPVMRSLSSDWDLATSTGTPYLKGVELVLQTEDQTLNVYIGPEGTTQLSATPGDNDIEERTFAALGCAMGLQNMFLQSAAAQNPTFHMRAW